MSVSTIEIARLVQKSTQEVNYSAITNGSFGASNIVNLNQKVLDTSGMITNPAGIVNDNSNAITLSPDANGVRSFTLKSGLYACYIEWPFDADANNIDCQWEIIDQVSGIPVYKSTLCHVSNVATGAYNGGQLYGSFYLPESRLLTLRLRNIVAIRWPFVAGISDPSDGAGQIFISVLFMRLD